MRSLVLAADLFQLIDVLLDPLQLVLNVVSLRLLSTQPEVAEEERVDAIQLQQLQRGLLLRAEGLL